MRKTLEEKWGRFALVVFDLTREINSKEAQAEDRRHLYAVFQAIGLDIAVAYVKGLLNTTEYPVYDYGNIVVLVAASERISREYTDGLFWGHVDMPKEGLGNCRRFQAAVRRDAAARRQKSGDVNKAVKAGLWRGVGRT